MSRHSEVGATLVEVLVAIGLTAVMLPTMATALITSHAGRATSQQQLKATALVHEAAEAVRTARDQDWTSVSTDGVYHPTISGSAWALTSGSEITDGLTRTVTITTAERDGSGNLVASGGTPDPATKHITVEVTWTTPYSGSVSNDFYLTDWHAT